MMLQDRQDLDLSTAPEKKVDQVAHPDKTGTNGGGELRIVVGVDGSRCADRALEFAAHEAARWGALLHVVCAYEVPPNSGWVVVPLEPFEEGAEASVRAALTRVHELEPEVVVKGVHVHGFAGSVLVEESKGASMLVVGSRGRGEVASLILGSISEHCVHHAGGCPVTIVGLKAS
jgi:nucleotide-binding universal stress UspA family protein